MRSALVLLAAALLCPALRAAGNPEWNGYWWESQPRAFKLGWVNGYAQAMDFAGSQALVECALNMQFYQAKFPNVSEKELYEKMCGNAGKDYDYHGIAFGQYVDGIDTFYADFRNKQLEVGWAIEYVRDQIRGKPAQELEAEVAAWRRCAAAVQTKDEEQIKQACTPPN